MIGDQRVLAVVTGRGGSKGLPRKNVLPLGGRPLIAWSIEAAKASRLVDHVILSTDDEEIAEVGRTWGCEVPFLRPAALAADESAISGALVHALDELAGVGSSFDYVVLLQATSPFREGHDIDACIRQTVENEDAPCISFTLAAKPPQLMFERGQNGRMTPIMGPLSDNRRRQNLATAYVPNGAVYVAAVPAYREQREFFRNDTLGYIMPPERSIDIDDAYDLKIAEAMLTSGLFTNDANTKETAE